MSTLAETVTEAATRCRNVDVQDAATIIAACTAREDEIADQLRMAGTQFGLFPEIVAEVLADIGLGTPPTPEARAMIHANYHALMERLASEQTDN